MIKERKKEGFTLIELLAVIVILVVIALIASPLIISIIEDSRKKAFENSVYGVMSTYDIKIAKEGNYKGIIYNFPEGNNELKYSGTKMSGGSIFLTPSGSIEVRELTDGRYCANGNKTNLIIKRGDCSIDLATAPVIKEAFINGNNFLGSGITKNDVESLFFVMVSDFPEGSVDISDKGNGSVMIWSKDENSNGKLEVYIGAIDDFVYANPISRYLFEKFNHLSVLDLNNFNTVTTTNMNLMFRETGYLSGNFTLKIGDHFDTSNVTTMSGMFHGTGFSNQRFRLNLGDKFDTKNVTDMGAIFYHTGRYSQFFTLDLGDKFNVDKVTNYGNAFVDTGMANLSFKPTATVKTEAEKDAILAKFPNIVITIKP